MKRLYIAGPMTGLPAFNYPAFFAAAVSLSAVGYEVENPAQNDPQDSWESYMRLSIVQIAKSDGICTLPNWFMSRGATIEVELARQLAMPDLFLEEWIQLAKEGR